MASLKPVYVVYYVRATPQSPNHSGRSFYVTDQEFDTREQAEKWIAEQKPGTAPQLEFTIVEIYRVVSV